MPRKSHFTWYAVCLAAVFLIIVVLVDRRAPTSGTDGSLLEIKDDEWIKGGRDASVTLVEYSDFQCPACKAYSRVVKRLNEAYQNRLRIVYRHFPLISIHPNSEPAARAAEAAGRQNKFWQMHDILFEKQADWSGDKNIDDALLFYAASIGLDRDKFREDYNSDEIKNAVREDLYTANALNLNGTPTFFLNGKKIENARSFDDYRKIIDKALSSAAAVELSQDDISASEDVDYYANIAVYINGVKTELNGAMNKKNKFIYLTDDPGVLRKTKSIADLSNLFDNLNMAITTDYITTPAGEQFCDDKNNSVKMFINGLRSEFNPFYSPNDLDSILISYGPLTDSNLKSQLESMPSGACEYSKKCPKDKT